MRVLLVDPPKRPWPLLRDTVIPPIGLAYLASYLRASGVEVNVLDCTALNIGWDGLRGILERLEPDLVGAGGPTCYSGEAARVLSIAKDAVPGVVTVAGGPHFTFTAEESLLRHPQIDFIVLGEGEKTLAELVRALEGGGRLRDVKGLALRRGGEVLFTEPRPLIKDLDSLPIPAWDLLPMQKYRLSAWGNAMMLTSSRGCPFKCRFCSERVFWGGVWRGHSPGRVVYEMELVWRKYGKKIIWFGDDTFNVDRERLLGIAEEIVERGLNVAWGFEGRADLILRDRDIIGRLREAGLFWVLVGVEASSDEELKRYGKGITLEQARQAFKILKEHDIITQAMFVVGERKDTVETIRRKVELAKELDVDFAIFTPLTPLPGTPLYEEAKAKGWLEVDDYSRYDFAHAVMPTETLTRREVDRLIAQCYMSFYARPTKILRALLSRNPYRRAVIRHFLKLVLFG